MVYTRNSKDLRPNVSPQSHNRTIDDNTVTSRSRSIAGGVCIESINHSVDNKELGDEIYFFTAVPKTHLRLAGHVRPPSLRPSPLSPPPLFCSLIVFFPTKLKRNIVV